MTLGTEFITAYVNINVTDKLIVRQDQFIYFLVFNAAWVEYGRIWSETIFSRVGVQALTPIVPKGLGLMFESTAPS